MFIINIKSLCGYLGADWRSQWKTQSTWICIIVYKLNISQIVNVGSHFKHYKTWKDVYERRQWKILMIKTHYTKFYKNLFKSQTYWLVHLLLIYWLCPLSCLLEQHGFTMTWIISLNDNDTMLLSWEWLQC